MGQAGRPFACLKLNPGNRMSIGRRPLLQDSFDHIAECAAGAAIHAEIVQRYAEAGNLAGLRYAVRCLCAYIRACDGGLQCINEIEADMAARAGRDA